MAPSNKNKNKQNKSTSPPQAVVDEGDANSTDATPSTTSSDDVTAAAAMAALEQLRLGAEQQQSNRGGRVATPQHLLGEAPGMRGNAEDSEERKLHAFWDTQPMIDDNGSGSLPPSLHAPIIPDKEPSQIRQTPYNMPKGFEWSELDIFNETDKEQVYELLVNNYVEDDDCLFRFDYSTDFLLWALTPPNYDPAFHLGVRSSKTKRLMAFISGVPANIRCYDTTKPMVEINFLCVHKKLRSKRLAPVLIKEITRRVNLTGVFQAVYTAGVILPTPIATCRYYHRSLDPKKLVEIQFSRIPPRMTLARMQKLYRLPKETTTKGLRPMEKRDVESAHRLLVKHLEKFQLAVVFDLEDFEHWLMPRKGVVNCYVAYNGEGGEDGEVTDLISFYHLPSTIMRNPKHSHLNAAYSFYNVATSVDLGTLMKDALTLAKNDEDMDVFNALSQMENGKVLEELKFGIGDGNLNYYLYNWCCPTLKSEDVGIVLL